MTYGNGYLLTPPPNMAFLLLPLFVWEGEEEIKEEEDGDPTEGNFWCVPMAPETIPEPRIDWEMEVGGVLARVVRYFGRDMGGDDFAMATLQAVCVRVCV